MGRGVRWELALVFFRKTTVEIPMVQTLFYYELPTMKRKGKNTRNKRERRGEGERGRRSRGGSDN